MKVLLLTVRSDFGGGPRHVNQLIESLPNDIDLFAAFPEQGEPYAEMWKNNPRIKNIIFLPYRKFSIFTLFKLKKFIKRNSIDVVHSHGNGAGVYSRLLKFIGTNVKVVHTFHGITNNYTSKIKKNLNCFIGRFLCDFTDKFILVSKGEMKLAQKMGFLKEEKSIVIYNGIEPFGEKKDEKRFNVVTLSRFDYQKNMDLAYEIASALKNQDVYFIWIGEGPDYDRLKQMAELENLNILFTGFSKNPESFLRSSSVYLSTSRFEGLPYALIEASSIGLPIVASNVVGNNEALEDGVSGFLFDTKEDAVRKILKLKEDAALYDSMSARARLFYQHNFTLKGMIEKIVLLYHDVVL